LIFLKLTYAKMKCRLLLYYLLLITQISVSQKNTTTENSIAKYLNEVKIATKRGETVWSKNLYGAIIFVDPRTRQMYTNEPDSAGILKANGEIYSGVLSVNVNIANTSLHWSGRDWAMIMLPLPANKQDRLNLICHELFHKAQPALGFHNLNTDNNHLDQKDGRIYLRLELNALEKALLSSTSSEKNKHLANALTFRKYRQTIYRDAGSTENNLELNEGLAEYTGNILCGRNKEQAVAHFRKVLAEFLTTPTFVRSFPYQTIPLYGYLLYERKKYWNREITAKTNLTNYFTSAFNVVPSEDSTTIENISRQYNASHVFAEETAREKRTLELIAAYKKKFIEQPHFEIKFEQMNISFNPGNIVPIEDKGTVYPNLRVTDRWGILLVEKGALMSPGWDKVSITNPTQIEGKSVKGEGWSLELSDAYELIRNGKQENFLLKKK
jgi:hypothetical protein